MSTALTPTPAAELVPRGTFADAAVAADAAARRTTFATYRAEKSAQTRRAQDADLACWASYLQAMGIAIAGRSFGEEPGAWEGVTWGLVAGFMRWQLEQGYAIGSINRRLATVQRYCGLAAQAGALTPEALTLIKTVKGYAGKRARNIDQERTETRVGRKKAEHTPIVLEQVRQLKDQPDTPQGRRDMLLICLLADHGLRVSEVCDLQVGCINLKSGTLNFYRRKVDRHETHKLSADTYRAAVAYLQHDAPATGQLLRGSRKNGLLVGGMKTAAANQRVGQLGRAIGVAHLSPHDLRHFWATNAVAAGSDAFALRDAGGWSSLDMPSRYVDRAKVANERLKQTL